jgi:hypothetical protein
VMRRLDVDGDGIFTPSEAAAYARAVIADLDVRLDDDRLPVSLLRVEVPVAADMNEGLGVIRVALAAPASSADGSHRISIHNAHMPSISVYLANALQPESKTARVVRQTRDSRQQTFSLDYEIRANGKASFAWLVFAIGALVILFRRRRASHGSDTASRANTAGSGTTFATIVSSGPFR